MAPDPVFAGGVDLAAGFGDALRATGLVAAGFLAAGFLAAGFFTAGVFDGGIFMPGILEWSICAATGLARASAAPPAIKRNLGGVDKFEPVSGSGKMDHSEEAVGELVIAGGDGAIDFEMAEHALDAIALLVERTVMLDLHTAV